jgi:chemotaxis protein MotB
MIHLAGLAVLGLVLSGGCVSDTLTATRMERDKYLEGFNEATKQANAEKVRADTLQRQIDQLSNNTNSKEAMIANLTTANGQLQSELQRLNALYQEALNRPLGGGPLPEGLSNELATFAASNPDLVEFDRGRGTVKFKSDVTFALGDAELTTKARDVINRFATILNSPAAAQYELLIAGHTDNTNVVNPATIAKGHKDNWYLSAHRAISVAEALMRQRISPNRVGVVGYAEQRPIAANTSEQGRAQNRRVEVLILPNTVRGSAVTTVGAPPARAMPAPAARTAPLPNKDTAALDLSLPNK